MKIVHCKKDKFDIYVGRPTIWGNPFDKKFYNNVATATLTDYLLYMYNNKQLCENAKKELKGQILSCWCAPVGGIEVWDEKIICHAQLLARIANE